MRKSCPGGHTYSLSTVTAPEFSSMLLSPLPVAACPALIMVAQHCSFDLFERLSDTVRFPQQLLRAAQQRVDLRGFWAAAAAPPHAAGAIDEVDVPATDAHTGEQAQGRDASWFL